MAINRVILNQGADQVYPQTDVESVNGLQAKLDEKQKTLAATNGIEITTGSTADDIKVKLDGSTLAASIDGLKVANDALSKVEAVTVGTTQTIKQLKITPAGGTEATISLLWADHATATAGTIVGVDADKMKGLAIPALPSDASSKTYVLICKNGTFEWSDQVVLQG